MSAERTLTPEVAADQLATAVAVLYKTALETLRPLVEFMPEGEARQEFVTHLLVTQVTVGQLALLLQGGGAALPAALATALLERLELQPGDLSGVIASGLRAAAALKALRAGKVIRTEFVTLTKGVQA